MQYDSKMQILYVKQYLKNSASNQDQEGSDGWAVNLFDVGNILSLWSGETKTKVETVGHISKAFR